MLYYTDLGEANPHVGRVRLDGYNRQVLYSAVNPNDVLIQNNKLYVVDSRNRTGQTSQLISSNLDGTEKSTADLPQLVRIKKNYHFVVGGNPESHLLI